MPMAKRKPKPALKRTSVFLTAAQLEQLAALHVASDVPVAVMIRRAVDAYLAEHGAGRKGTR
jgi:hypothetical protein